MLIPSKYPPILWTFCCLYITAQLVGFVFWSAECDLSFPSDTAMTVCLYLYVRKFIMTMILNSAASSHSLSVISLHSCMSHDLPPPNHHSDILSCSKAPQKKKNITFEKLMTRGSELPGVLQPCQSLNDFLNVVPKSNLSIFIFLFLLFSLQKTSLEGNFVLHHHKSLKSLSICLSSLRRT